MSTPKSASKNSWIQVSETVLLESSFMEIVQRDCRTSDDVQPPRTHRFYLFKSRDWCNIIPVTEDGKIVMVKQFRAGINEHTVEIPGGVADGVDRDIQESALREMTEETGYTLVPGARCVKLGASFPNPAIQDNRTHSFVVGPVRKTQEQKLDPGEMIDVVEVPFAQIPEMIRSGEISHALMLNAFLFLALEKGKGGDALTQGLDSFRRV